MQRKAPSDKAQSDSTNQQPDSGKQRRHVTNNDKTREKRALGRRRAAMLVRY